MYGVWSTSRVSGVKEQTRKTTAYKLVAAEFDINGLVHVGSG